MSDAAAISAFNAAVDAGRFAREREAKLAARIEALEKRLAEMEQAFSNHLRNHPPGYKSL